MYAVFRTHKFDKEADKLLSKEEHEELENFEKKQLADNPYVGDPLHYKFFREKRDGHKRVYFLIYDDIKAVLMVGISDKKTQQETIDEIKNHLEQYHDLIKESIKQHDEYDRA